MIPQVNWDLPKFWFLSLGRDYRPHLWRTLIGGQKDRVRKVRAMWTVRTAVSHPVFFYIKVIEIKRRDFCLAFLQPPAMWHQRFFLSKHFTGGSFSMPGCTDLHRQTLSLPGTRSPNGGFMRKFNLWNQLSCAQDKPDCSPKWKHVSRGVCLFPSCWRQQWVGQLEFASLMGFFIDLLIQMCVSNLCWCCAL